MSLLFFDGFQDGATMPKPEWSPAVSFFSVTGRDGSTNGAGTVSGPRSLNLPSAVTTCIAGVAWQVTSSGGLNPGSSNYMLGFLRSGTVECVICPNPSGLIELRRTSGTGTLLATSSGHPPLTANVWAHIQAKVTLHSSAGSVEVKLNGATVLTFSGQTAGTTGDVTAINIGLPGSGNAHYDDMWVCDTVDATATQGAANNDFLGDLKVVTLFPTGAGDSTQWTPSTGANWGAVDEVPPNTSDYVSTNVPGNRDLYGLGDLPAGAGSPKAIRVGLYAQKNDAGAASVKPVIKESGGTVTVESALALSTSWASYYGPVRTVKPSGGAWTVSEVNALQAGIELA